MDYEDAIPMIRQELYEAYKKHGEMPPDIIHRAAIVCEESGELIQASYDCVYGKGTLEQCRLEAVHTCATALRFLMSLPADA